MSESEKKMKENKSMWLRKCQFLTSQKWKNVFPSSIGAWESREKFMLRYQTSFKSQWYENTTKTHFGNMLIC